MQPLSAFHHVAITVRDRDASAAWYKDVLGLVELFREEGDTRRGCILGFADGGFSVGIVEHDGSDKQRFEPVRIGLDHLALTVATRDAIDEWATRLSERGVEHSGVIDIPPGAILNFKDPDGIALALFWDRDVT